MSIKLWVPSRNRAAQLHLLLESVEKNAPDLFDIYVNYDWSDIPYGEAYVKLRCSPLGKKCHWQRRNNYGTEWFEFLEENRGDLICHFVDDCIFYRETNITEEDIRFILDEWYGWDFLGFNWRVGLDTVVKEHRKKESIKYPSSLKYSDLVCNWNYTEYDSLWENYWSFCYSLDGMIYRVNDLLEYLDYVQDKNYNDPAWTEHWLCHSPCNSTIGRPWMASPVRSTCFSNHLNSVHSRGYDAAGQFSYSVEELNRKYLEGYIIDINSINYNKVCCGHMQLPFSFIKDE